MWCWLKARNAMSLFKLILESSLIPVTDAIIHTVYQVLGRVGRNLRQVKNRVEGKKRQQNERK